MPRCRCGKYTLEKDEARIRMNDTVHTSLDYNGPGAFCGPARHIEYAEALDMLKTARALIVEVNDCGVGASNRYWYVEHATLCQGQSPNGKRDGDPCDCGLEAWETKARAFIDKTGWI